jgi:ABC-type nitrate/sulfonate/bicarbonate transport system substrate-binding protein
MKTKFSRRVFHLIIVSVILCGPSLAHPAFIKTNFASSITGESMSAVWVAQEQGLFRKYGLDMQFIIMPRPPLTIAAMIAGEIDMAVTGPGTFLNASIGGVDIVGIANFFQKLDYTLNGRPELKKPEDLQGKRIAISGTGSTSHIVPLLALQTLGIDPNQAKISFIIIPGTELNRRMALESGTADATSLRGAMGELYRNKGYPALFDFKGSNTTMPQTVVSTTRRTAANKPQLVEAYLKAIIEGIAFMVEPANKEVVSRIVASKLRLTNPADAEEAYQSVVGCYERIPYPNLDGMKRLQTVLISINPKLATVRPETVVDNSFINKLESSGFIKGIYKTR